MPGQGLTGPGFKLGDPRAGAIFLGGRGGPNEFGRIALNFSSAREGASKEGSWGTEQGKKVRRRFISKCSRSEGGSVKGQEMNGVSQEELGNEKYGPGERGHRNRCEMFRF